MSKHREEERKVGTAGCPDTVDGVCGLGKISTDTIRVDPLGEHLRPARWGGPGAC